MSKLSIYETSWINLVFENRNKEYGAYQLRQDCAKVSVKAFFTGILLVSLFVLLTKVKGVMPSTILPETPIPTIIDQEIHVTSLNLQQRLKKNIPKVPSKNTEIPITKANLIHPIIVSSSEATPEIAPNKEMSTSSTDVSDGQGTASNNSYPSSTKGASDGKPTSDGIEIINANSLDRLPEYPGGIAKFYAYVGSNFEKPEIEDHESIRVVVYFIIEKDGSMTSIQVKSDPGQGIGKEAIRVLKSLKTKWSPGMVNSKAVRTAYSLPITIMLE